MTAAIAHCRQQQLIAAAEIAEVGWNERRAVLGMADYFAEESLLEQGLAADPDICHASHNSGMADPKRLLMAEQWNLFSRAIGLSDKSATQRLEMRRAFYAGAQCILFRVISNFAPEAEPTDEDLAIMQGVQDELSDFAEQVKNGRA